MAECLRCSLPDCEYPTGQHDALAKAKELLGNDFDQAYKFAFVRNPWDRFVSWYALMQKTMTAPETRAAELLDPDSAHWKGFDAFLETWAKDIAVINGRNLPRLSQWDQLADADGNLLTNGLGRFESFAEDLRFLFAEAGLPNPAPQRINASDHLHYSQYYSDAGRELIEEVFHQDITHFGYSFEHDNYLGEMRPDQ